ncbi:YybS family protein [Peribacillus kribbensis]|uniref:YybS family protein n=1 Tax=Peribacillus kribbensis TaxID=356658 RepID=UPI000408D012|nr:YybS family protein [Peribacillus kribbensis]
MNNGRKIAESAALLTVFCILLFLCLQLPVIGTFLTLILPLPFVLVASKYDLSWSICYLAAGAVLTTVIGSLYFLPTALLFGGTGIAIGYNLRKKNSFGTLYLSSVMIFLTGMVILYIFIIYFLHMNIIETAIKMMENSMNQSSKFLEQLGQAPNEAVTKNFTEKLKMIKMLVPSIFVISSMTMVLVILAVLTPFLKRLSKTPLIWKSLGNLQLPKSVLWYYLIVMALSFFVHSGQGTMFIIIANLLYILQFLILLQGYSLVFFFSSVKGWSKALTWTAVVFSFFLPIFQYVIRLLGIIDLGMRIRERYQNK